MKSILLYANKDAGQESRLQAALDLTRAFNGHLGLLQVRISPAIVASDGMAGLAGYDLTAQIEADLAALAAENRQALEPKLAAEGAAWTWIDDRGDPAQVILDHSRLADLVVLSLTSAKLGLRDQLPLVGSVAVHGRSPVLAVPSAWRGFDPAGPAMIAWNGSFEAAHALRLALPMLKTSSRVVLATFGDAGDGALPGESAALYLDRHGLKVEVEARPAAGDIAGALLSAAAELKAAYMVMGAYGHSRMREFLLGGVTRTLLSNTQVPLLLAH